MKQTNLPRGYDGSKTKITLYELQIGYWENGGIYGHYMGTGNQTFGYA